MQTIEVDLAETAVPLKWAEVFGSDGPVHVEIGSGKGKFLLELAATLPTINFLGVERADKYHRLVCTKAARRGLANVRCLRTTAEDLLFRLVPDASVEVLYVLFPDPWPKKRHHKRRLVKAEVTREMVRIIKPGGRLLVKSDHAGYAAVIDEVLAATPGLTAVDPQQAFADLPSTGFESKYLVEGRPIHAFAMDRD